MNDRNTEEVEYDPLIGKRLASYEILRRVARGGMGVVYKARHVYIDKIVALKVLDPELSQREDLIERFQTEAQSLARVEHENVVKIIDIIEEENVHFIVMDFAEGKNLRVYVKDHGPLSESELISVARQTAEALYAAHKQGILHRDIKPENIIRNSRGRCKLADFGLAGDLRLISEGHEGPLNFGTPAYSAPEILRRMKPDVRSDIFAFGASLYFAATGEPPFGKTGAQQIMMRQKQGAELLESIRHDLSPALSRLIHDCISLHPKGRPSDFRDVLSSLPSRKSTRIRGATATSTRPTTGSTSTTGPVQTESRSLDTVPTNVEPNKAGLWAAVAAFVAIGLVGALVIWQVQKGGDSNTNAEDNTPVIAGGNRPANVSVPPEASTPPTNTPDEPSFDPADEAFVAAKLQGRAALANADYVEAYAAWVGFLERFAESSYAAQANQKLQDVLDRVNTLRQEAIESVEADVDDAVNDDRTADALDTLNRFPPELGKALGSQDAFAQADRLASLRQQILAADSSALANVLKQADRLRDDWIKKYRSSDSSESIQKLYADRLLTEQHLMKQFVAGRLKDTQTTVNERLTSIRKLLEGAHQECAEAESARLRHHCQTRPAWASQATTAIESARQYALDQNFTEAETKLADLLKNLQEQRSTEANKQPLAISEMVREDDFVYELSKQVRDELQIAGGIELALRDRFSELLASGRVTEVYVHSGIDADGKRDGELLKIEGRISEAEETYAIIDKQRVEFSMVRDKDVSRLLRDSSDYRVLQTLTAWAIATGAQRDAELALKRLQKFESAPRDVISGVERWVSDKQLSASAVRRLAFLAAWPQLKDLPATETGGLEPDLMRAMQGVAKNDKTAASDFLTLVRGLKTPELVHLGSLKKAMQLVGKPTRDDLKICAALEPENAEVQWRLAQAYDRSGDHRLAETAARKALWLDASLEPAWEFLRENR
ncbi:serine/threonine-protein kinase [Planctomycetota bacterium]|nr:serine/threonine-protein kinase [Planctomycetota bacterium]